MPCTMALTCKDIQQGKCRMSSLSIEASAIRPLQALTTRPAQVSADCEHSLPHAFGTQWRDVACGLPFGALSGCLWMVQSGDSGSWPTLLLSTCRAEFSKVLSTWIRSGILWRASQRAAPQHFDLCSEKLACYHWYSKDNVSGKW